MPTAHGLRHDPACAFDQWREQQNPRPVPPDRPGPSTPACTCDALNPAPSPTPPARDSGRDEAREAVARHVCVCGHPRDGHVVPAATYGNGCDACSCALYRPCLTAEELHAAITDCLIGQPVTRDGWSVPLTPIDAHLLADRLLALPELDKLLRRPS